jgi:hypothetical protein
MICSKRLYHQFLHIGFQSLCDNLIRLVTLVDRNHLLQAQDFHGTHRSRCSVLADQRPVYSPGLNIRSVMQARSKSKVNGELKKVLHIIWDSLPLAASAYFSFKIERPDRASGIGNKPILLEVKDYDYFVGVLIWIEI